MGKILALRAPKYLCMSLFSFMSHTKFYINRAINDRVRAKSFHCSNLACQKWETFWPHGPNVFLYVPFVTKVPHTKFDINRMVYDRFSAKTFHFRNLARQKWAKLRPHWPENISVCHFCHKCTSYKI